MRKTTLFLSLGILLLSCKTQVTQPESGFEQPFVFGSTSTPAAAGARINVRIGFTAVGSNLCYSLDEVNTKAVSGNRVQVNALWKPAKNPGSFVCAHALYQKDSFATVIFPTAGRYYIDFMNGDKVSKTDSIQVN